MPRRSFQGILITLVLAASLTANEIERYAGRKITEIRISDLTYTPDGRVRRQLVSRVGEVFNAANQRRDVERLERLAVFSAIEVIPEDDGAGGVILNVNLTEISRVFPYPSVEINSENGLSIGLGVKTANPGGLAAHMQGYAQFGGSTNVEFIAERQWLAPKPFFYRFRLMQRRRTNELDDFKENATDPFLKMGKHLTESLRLGGSFRYFTLSSQRDGVTTSPSNRDHLWAPGAFVAFDNRDSWFLTHRGWRNEVDLSRTFGDGRYWTTNIDLRRYQPIADRHTLALFSLTTLQTGTVGVGRDVPIHQDYHLGGANSMRGWDIDARHGKNQMINTVEYRYDIVKPRPLKLWKISLRLGVQAAAFSDFGTAWDEGDQFSKQFIGSGGIGIRLIVPWIQMIRLDLAFGQSGTGIHPHIGFYEKADEQRKRVR